MPSKSALSREECRAYWATSPEAFISTACFTYDPRLKGEKIIPFDLYPYQVEDLKAIEKVISDSGIMIYEKSRVMGWSWEVTTPMLWHWLFSKEPFTALLGSRKMQYVDRIGSWDTLFGKIRFNLYRIPAWLLPKGFDRNKHDNVARLINPETGSALLGDIPDNFGRAGRYDVAIADEWAHWENQEGAFAAMQQTSRALILGGTPCGKEMQYSMRNNPAYTLLTRHWSEHPIHGAGLYKDAETGALRSPWYDRQCELIGVPWIIAQELDISYERSLGSRIFELFIPRPMEQGGHLYEYVEGMFANASLYTFWDFGVSDETAIEIFAEFDGKFWGIGEIVGREASAEEWAEILNKQWPGLNKATHIGDPYSLNSRGPTLASWFSELHRKGITIIPSGMGTIGEMIAQANADLKRGKFYIDPRKQPRLYDSLIGWQWRTVKTAAGPVTLDRPAHDKHSHPGTAFYYGTWFLRDNRVAEYTPTLDKIPEPVSAFEDKSYINSPSGVKSDEPFSFGRPW